MKSIHTIQSYYKDLNPNTSFEALKVLPHIIDLIGLDLVKDHSSVWLGIIVFLDIFCQIESNTNIPQFPRSEQDKLLRTFSEKAVDHGISGFKNKSFCTAFPNLLHRQKFVPIFLALCSDKVMLAITAYLANIPLDKRELDIIFRFIWATSIDYFEVAISKVFCLSLLSGQSNSHLHNLREIYEYSRYHGLMPKAELAVMKRSIDWITE